MSATERDHEVDVQGGVEGFNTGDDNKVLEQFASDVTFVVPGSSGVAGIYQGRDELARFFERLHTLSGGSFKVETEEVLANDDRLVLFLRFTAQRDGESLNVLMAGFHDDLGPDGFRKASFLPDDQDAFDRFFAPA